MCTANKLCQYYHLPTSSIYDSSINRLALSPVGRNSLLCQGRTPSNYSFSIAEMQRQ
uniref:Uncharacterized protein n=1 Tax=Aegilops tauschii subsp. strangulata TaxID=200361 RepID=A0A452YGE1_AEGTS